MELENNKIQKTYIKFQSLQQQMKDIVGQIEEISLRLHEVDSIMVSIEETSKIEKGTEILVPVSNGIFIKAEAKETKDFLVNIGASKVTTKNTDQVIKMLEKQKIELLNLQTELSKEAEKYEKELLDLQKELQDLDNKTNKTENNDSDEY